MKIKVRKSELDPRELNILLENGAKIIRNYENQRFGTPLIGFVDMKKRTLLPDGKVYTTDQIEINGKIFNLASGPQEYFNEFTEV